MILCNANSSVIKLQIYSIHLNEFTQGPNYHPPKVLLILGRSMIELYMQVEFIKLVYDQPQSKSHFINFSVENQQEDQLNYDQTFVEKAQTVVELENISPLNFHLVVGPDKNAICHYQIYFISKFSQPVKRKIPLQLESILNNYFQHDIFEDIQPLEQLYSFQGGKLEYFVHVTQTKKLENAEEIQKLSLEFNKKKVSLRPSVATSRESQNTFKEIDTGISLPQKKSNIDVALLVLPNVPTLNAKKSLHQMSVQQIAEQLVNKNEQKHDKSQISHSMAMTNKWFIKLDKKGSEIESEYLLASSNFKLKLVAILLFIIVSVMIGGSLFESKDLKMSKMKSKGQSGKKKSRRNNSKSGQHQL